MRDISARELKVHNILAVERFQDNTRRMIEFSVLRPCSYGSPGDEMRLFLTEDGYQAALHSQKRREIKIKRYKDNADTIIGNMDTSIFLGGKEPTTLKELAAVLGKETIDTYNTGESRGRETSHSLNYQKLGKDMPYLLMKSSAALNLT